MRPVRRHPDSTTDRRSAQGIGTTVEAQRPPPLLRRWPLIREQLRRSAGKRSAPGTEGRTHGSQGRTSTSLRAGEASTSQNGRRCCAGAPRWPPFQEARAGAPRAARSLSAATTPLGLDRVPPVQSPILAQV